MRVNFTDLRGKLWTEQKLILDFSTPHAHQEHGRVEAKVKVLKEFLMRSGELGKRHSYLEWETIGCHISSMINSLPICSNSDDSGGAYGELNLITPNLFILGRNNSRSPEKFVNFESNPGKALKVLAETNQQIFDLLGSYICRFIPGKKYTDISPPQLNDIVLVLMKEAQRSRNTLYKFGRVVQLCVDGRQSKVQVEYQNATESVRRNVIRSIQNLVLILGVNDISFNTYEHHVAAWAQRKYL